MSYSTNPVVDAERYMEKRAADSAVVEEAYRQAYDDFMGAVRRVGMGRDNPVPPAMADLVRDAVIEAAGEGEATLHKGVTAILCQSACGADMRSEVYELMVSMARRHAEWEASRA